MKGFFKVLVWILILGGVGFGVYAILPEYPHNLVKSIIQPYVDVQAKTRIAQVKALKNKDQDACYEDILEPHTRTQVWVYEPSDGTGREKVTFYGRGAFINIKELDGHDDYMYTSTTVKFEFLINGKNVTINAYIEGKLQDEAVRDLMIRELYTGQKS